MGNKEKYIFVFKVLADFFINIKSAIPFIKKIPIKHSNQKQLKILNSAEIKIKTLNK
jgi:hypothetical protein